MQVLQLYACGRCGECILACPVCEETKDQNLAPPFKLQALKALANAKYGIRAILFGSQKENQEDVMKVASSLYLCTLCGRCMTVCPYLFDFVDLWEKARENAVMKGFEPTPIREITETTLADKNFLKRPHERRTGWTRRLEVPEKESAETLYFVGCVISYAPSLRPAAAGVTAILNAAKEDWAILSDEWCCGVPLKFGGGTEHLREFVAHNVERIEASGAKRVVFSCPGCYRMFKQEYPRILGRSLKFATQHIAELASDYLKTGRLSLKDKIPEKTAYHDPCELSRLLGVIDAPRNALGEISTTLLELPENKFNALCCGGGGLYKAVDTNTSLEIAKKRIRQAEAIGLETLVTACPSCIMNFRQATQFMKSDVKILDIAEAVAQQIESGT